MTRYRHNDSLTSTLRKKTFAAPTRQRRPDDSTRGTRKLVEPEPPLLTAEEAAARFWKGRLREARNMTAVLCGDPEPSRSALHGGMRSVEEAATIARPAPSMPRFKFMERA
jgi:hypothetical protein